MKTQNFKPPLPIVVAAVLATIMALVDVVDTVLIGIEFGWSNTFGTFLRDACLLVGGMTLLMRMPMGGGLTFVVLCLSLLRLGRADDAFELVNVLAIPAVVLMLLPVSLNWWWHRKDLRREPV